jgi:hypothetical protein
MNEELGEEGNNETSHTSEECRHSFLFEGKYGCHTDIYRCKKCKCMMKYHWGDMQQMNIMHTTDDLVRVKL